MEYSNLTSITHGNIELAPGTPKAFAARVLPNSEANHANGRYGILLYQEVAISDFSIHYNVYSIEERFQLNVKRDSQALILYVALKNDLHLQAEGCDEVLMKEGQFNIAFLPRLDCTASFEKVGDYENFKIYFPVLYLRECLKIFPFIEEFLQQAAEDRPAGLLKQPGWISPKIFYVINEFLECNYTGLLRQLYFETLIKELLLLLLMQTHKNGTDYNSYMQNLYEAKYIVEKNPARHFTISDIAEQVGLNEARLKTGFRQVFGIGLSEFMTQAKMQKAYVWVIETDKPFKEIAHLTGYGTLQNFLTAFKNYFNATPGSVRKTFRQMKN